VTVDIDGAFVFDSFEHRVDYDEGACPSDTGTTYQPNTAHHIMYHTPVLRPFSGTTRVGRYSPWPHFSNNGLQFYCQNVVPKYVLTFIYFRPIGADFRFEVPGQSSVGLIGGGRGQ